MDLLSHKPKSGFLPSSAPAKLEREASYSRQEVSFFFLKDPQSPLVNM